MRARHILLFLAVASCSVTGLLVACGGTSDTPPPVDAGKDGTLDAAKDAAPDVVDAGPIPCATDADLFTVAIPDGNIGDSGVSVQACGTCLKTSCKTDISDCNKICDCKDAVIGLYDCLSKGKGLQTCGIQNFLGASQDTQNIGLSLVGCASSKCKDACGLGDGGFLTDSGAQDAGGGG